MPISMSPSARYVTQQNVWGIQYGRNLTDRIIKKYQKRGYFSSGLSKANFKNEQQEKRKKIKLETLFQGF